jgi:hypothetical protein
MSARELGLLQVLRGASDLPGHAGSSAIDAKGFAGVAVMSERLSG